MKSAWKLDEYNHVEHKKKMQTGDNMKKTIECTKKEPVDHIPGSVNAPFATLNNRVPDRQVNLLSSGKTTED